MKGNAGGAASGIRTSNLALNPASHPQWPTRLPSHPCTKDPMTPPLPLSPQVSALGGNLGQEKGQPSHPCGSRI